MKRYDPDAELATRDVVSRAIWQEMQSEKVPHVFLDVTHLDPEFIRDRFPTITRTCLRYGLDITKTLIPVSPSAHFIIGGTRTSENGTTSVPGLFAAGEVSCNGIHGANRLASNSLLEGLVFGARAGREAGAAPLKPVEKSMLMSALAERCPQWISAPSPYPEIPTSAKERLKEAMWNWAGMVRNQDSLTEALHLLETWEPFTTTPAVSQAEGEFKNLVTIAFLIVRSALMRKNSIGVHYRSDDPHAGEPSDSRHVAFQWPERSEGYWS